MYIYTVNIRRSSVSKATGYGLDDRMIGGSIPGGAGNFSLHHHVQTGSGAHLASYSTGTGGSFPEGKAAGSWSWSLTSVKCRGQRMHWAIPPLPQYVFMAWCLVKHRENFTFLTLLLFYTVNSQCSSVCLETRLRAGRQGFNSRQAQWLDSFFAAASRPALGPTQPPIQWVQGALSPGVKRSGREVDHSPAPSDEVKNAWSCYPHSPIRLQGVVLS
jgi:hypothetical protein